jgi:hypothetical protein
VRQFRAPATAFRLAGHRSPALCAAGFHREMMMAELRRAVQLRLRIPLTRCVRLSHNHLAQSCGFSPGGSETAAFSFSGREIAPLLKQDKIFRINTLKTHQKGAPNSL